MSSVAEGPANLTRVPRLVTGEASSSAFCVSIGTFVLVLRQYLYFVLATQVNRHVRDMHGVYVARPDERCVSICTGVLVKHVNLRSA